MPKNAFDLYQICTVFERDFIANKNGVSPQNADLILNSIAFILTSAIIVLSYSYILFYIWHKHKYLKKYGTRYSKYWKYHK